MNRRTMAIVMMLAVSLLVVGQSAATAQDKSQEKAQKKAAKQAEARKLAQDSLNQLYKVKPSAKASISAAAGYAAFSNTGMKILVAGGGKGEGIAFDNATQKITYMKMLEVQAGLGMGAKKFRTIFVFETQDALNQFVNSGWEFGGQATAAAKTSDKGGAYQGATTVAPGVWMYQITEKGLALELTGKGTKYYKDDDLN